MAAILFGFQMALAQTVFLSDLGLCDHFEKFAFRMSKVRFSVFEWFEPFKNRTLKRSVFEWIRN